MESTELGLYEPIIDDLLIGDHAAEASAAASIPAPTYQRPLRPKAMSIATQTSSEKASYIPISSAEVTGQVHSGAGSRQSFQGPGRQAGRSCPGSSAGWARTGATTTPRSILRSRTWRADP